MLVMSKNLSYYVPEFLYSKSGLSRNKLGNVKIASIYKFTLKVNPFLVYHMSNVDSSNGGVQSAGIIGVRRPNGGRQKRRIPFEL